MVALFLLAAMFPVAAAKQGNLIGVVVGLVISLPVLAVLAAKLGQIADEEWKE